MALVPMFLGYFLFGVGLARVRPSTATTLTLTEPAVAAILAVVVVGERLGIMGWSGMAILAAALAVLAFAPTNVTGPRVVGRRPATPADVPEDALLAGPASRPGAADSRG
jgi:DME family drug/metabolite transporter